MQAADEALHDEPCLEVQPFDLLDDLGAEIFFGRKGHV
jgi:hypothetical protein